MAIKRKKQSLATRRKISLKMKGKKNPFYGKAHSRAWKKKESLAKRGKKNPMFGKTHGGSTIKKMRQAAHRRAAKFSR